MTSPTEVFLERLALQRAQPLSEGARGSVRLDLTHAGRSEHWRVSIGQDEVVVSRDAAAADCVVRADRSLFDEVVSGRANAMAALLRGALVIEGDPVPLVFLQRMFPGPSTANGAAAGRCA